MRLPAVRSQLRVPARPSGSLADALGGDDVSRLQTDVHLLIHHAEAHDQEARYGEGGGRQDDQLQTALQPSGRGR